MLKRDSCIV